ncbi:MAG: excisionase family DNA-binding protein [Acidimicrobiales bacterium]
MAPASHKRRPPVDVGVVGVYIGCPEGYLRRLLFERHIPFLRVGGTKGRFMPADLDAWLEAHHLEAVR